MRRKHHSVDARLESLKREQSEALHRVCEAVVLGEISPCHTSYAQYHVGDSHSARRQVSQEAKKETTSELEERILVSTAHSLLIELTCSNRPFGRNVKMEYFVVDTELFCKG